MTAPTKSAPVCAALAPEHKSSLADLFVRLRENQDGNFFHPHPLTEEEAAARANYSGRDFYCVMLLENRVIGYGMLRGWDEGYEVPSLGIAIDPQSRGHGYSRILMNFLHTVAKERGAKRVRLKVDPQNKAAAELYRSIGYVLEPQEDGQLIGLLDLDQLKA